jgi:hypothetical protein
VLDGSHLGSRTPLPTACLGIRDRSPTSLKKERTYMDNMLCGDSVVVASKEQISCPLGEESAILNLKTSIYYGLDGVGTRIWNLIQQPRRIAEVRDLVSQEYEVEASRCQSDLLDLIKQMHAEGLIEIRPAATA